MSIIPQQTLFVWNEIENLEDLQLYEKSFFIQYFDTAFSIFSGRAGGLAIQYITFVI